MYDLDFCKFLGKTRKTRPSLHELMPKCAVQFLTHPGRSGHGNRSPASYDGRDV